MLGEGVSEGESEGESEAESIVTPPAKKKVCFSITKFGDFHACY